MYSASKSHRELFNTLAKILLGMMKC
jgi:hypothetical protein